MLKKLKDEYVQVAIGMLFVLAIAIIPLIIIGVYSHPCADDYSYGYYTHAFWSTTNSLSQTLHWALYQVKATYDTWQGTFSSVFLMSLSPAIWGEGYYFLTPIIMLTMIIASHFYFLKKVIVDLLYCSKSIWLITSSIVCFLLVETIFVPVEGLYWYNGAVHYVFMHGCMIILFGLMLSLAYTKKTIKKIFLCLFACLFAVLCGGSNYPTALLGILGTLLIVGILMWKRKRICASIPLIIYGISFYMNVTAYGNQIRQTNFEKSSPLETIVESFMEMFEYMSIWMSVQIFLFMILMIPVFWKIADTEKTKFKFPLAVTLLSICSNACMLTPGLYAMGVSGAGRTLNIVKMWFVLMLFFNEAYWIGYIKKKSFLKLPEKKIDIRIWMVGIYLLIFVAFVVNVERRMCDYSSYAAYVSLRAGEAQQYHQEYLDRVEILTSEKKEVEIKPYSVKPYLLYFDDITTDVYDWRNNAVARWYVKDYVYLRE